MKLKNIVKPEWFCGVKSKYLCSVGGGGVIISDTQQNNYEVEFQFVNLSDTYKHYIGIKIVRGPYLSFGTL